MVQLLRVELLYLVQRGMELRAKRRWILSAALLVATGAVGYGVGVTWLHAQRGSASASRDSAPVASPESLPTCATSRPALLPESNFSGFSQVVNAADDVPPFHIHSGATPSFAAYTTFQRGALVGYVSNIVHQTPYWQENLALQREFGSANSYGKVPLLPLRGQVVTDTPGILEVYEDVDVFSSHAGVVSMSDTVATDLAASSAAKPIAIRSLNLPIMASTSAEEYAEVPGNPGYEHHVDVQVTSKRVFLQMDFRGGAEIPLDAVASTVRIATQRLVMACGRGL